MPLIFAIDAKIMVYGAKFARKIAQTAPLSEYIESFWDPSEDTQSDDEYLAYVKNYAHVRTSSLVTRFHSHHFGLGFLASYWHRIFRL